MDVTEYQEQIKRTMNWNLGPQQQLAVLSLGLIGEMAETLKEAGKPVYAWDREKLIGEFGDITWYAGNLMNVLQVSFQDLINVIDTPSPTRQPIFTALLEAALLGDTIKKTIGQGHVLDTAKMINHLITIVDCLLVAVKVYKLNLEEIFEKNIAKLETRYPNGFNTDDSVNRVDERG